MPEEQKDKEEKIPEPADLPVRQIIIETDGNFIRIKSAEVAGNIEMIAILERLVIALNNKMNGK